MRQKVVPRANREAIAGFIRPPLQLGLVKPGTDFRHEVLVPTYRRSRCPTARDNGQPATDRRSRGADALSIGLHEGMAASLLSCSHVALELLPLLMVEALMR